MNFRSKPVQVPSAIYRIIERGNRSDNLVNQGEIKKQMNVIIGRLKNVIVDNIAEQIHQEDKKYGPSKANKLARKMVDELWENKYSIVSGKVVLKRLKTWSSKRFKTSFSENQIAQELTKS